MTHVSQRRRSLAAGLMALAAQAPAWSADTFPAKPLRLVVPFGAGGPNDILARLVADHLSRRLGQAVVVDNRAGAGGNIGAEAAATAAPDGYNLFWAQSATHGINPAIYKRLGFDPLRDFTPVALVGQVPLVFMTRPEGRVKSLGELNALAKAEPEVLTYATGGVGTSPHVAGELFKSMARVGMRHVAYKGSNGALTDAIAGHVDIVIDGLSSGIRFIKSGQLIPLAVTSQERLPGLPKAPTVGETLPGYEALSWSAIAAPAGTPAPIVAVLNREINAVLQSATLRERFQDLYVTPTGGTPESMDKFVRSELVKWKKVAMERSITSE